MAPKTLALVDGKKKEERTSPPGDGPYGVIDGRLCRFGSEGFDPLSNFDARIHQEIVRDNGLTTERKFVVRGPLNTGEALPETSIDANEFSSMAWVAREWGASAIISAGHTKRDQLRAAIQVVSERPVPCARVYTHTGWREIDGKWWFLSGNGATGRSDIVVDLGSDLTRYQLPQQPEQVEDAVRTSLALLEVAEPTISVPLFGATYRAATSEFLPPDLTVWLEGETGTYKSSLAALFLSHYGNFPRNELIGWSGTRNALEKSAFVLKDCLQVLDDWVPTPDTRRDYEMKAESILRAQGNRSGRRRLDRNLADRPEFRPRGLILVTGESHPTSTQSALARTLHLKCQREFVHLQELAKLQKTASRLPHAMSGFIQWLQPRVPGLQRELRENLENCRSVYQEDLLSNDLLQCHPRIPEVLAHLHVGCTLALDFALEVGAISEEKDYEMREYCRQALMTIGAGQAQLLADVKPTLSFLRAIWALLKTGRVSLLPGDTESERANNGGEHLGWFSKDNVYLHPENAFRVVSVFCRDSGSPFPVAANALWRMFKDQQLSEAEEGRNIGRARIDGVQHRLLVLKRDQIEEVVGEDLPIQGSRRFD